MAISAPGGVTRDAMARRAVARRRAGLAAQILLGVLGPVMMFILLVQEFEVYFTIGTDPLTATQGDGIRYLWTAGVAVGIALAGVILAIARRRVVAFIAAVALLVGMLGVAFVLAVPQGRWTPAPEVNHLPADYVPCFSGSGTCRGG